MKTVKLYYTSTAWGTNFSLEEPQSTGPNNAPGFFEAGEYWDKEYILPEGVEIAMSEGGTREFYRNGTHFALTYDKNTPVLTDGQETIYLKKA